MSIHTESPEQSGQHLLLNEKLLEIDLIYQRPLNISRVNEMAKNFDETLLITMVVNQRANGHYYVIDGQHRLAAIRKITPGLKVHCLVYRYLSLEEEAEKFDELNGYRGAPRAVDRFRAQEVANRPVALAIKTAVEKAGYTLILEHGSSKKSQPCRTNAVAALREIYNLSGADGVEKTLRTIKLIWPDDPLNGVGYVIKAAHLFLSRYENDPRFQIKTLVDHLSSRSIAYIKRQSTNFNGHAATNLARCILAEYNRNLRTLRLPDSFPIYE